MTVPKHCCHSYSRIRLMQLVFILTIGCSYGMRFKALIMAKYFHMFSYDILKLFHDEKLPIFRVTFDPLIERGEEEVFHYGSLLPLLIVSQCKTRRLLYLLQP